MSDPLSWGSGLIDRYGATIVGLTIGTAAKYGMMLSEGRRPRPSGLLADILLFGMLGLAHAPIMADDHNRATGTTKHR